MLTIALLALTAPLAPRPPAAVDQILTWQPGMVTCDGGAQAFVSPPDPDPAFISWFDPATAPLRFTFRIAGDGRPTGVTRDGAAYAAASTDVAPALVASRFAAGTVRNRCSITFTPRRVPVAEAPVADAMLVTMVEGSIRPRALWDRVMPAATTCYDPAPAVLLRAFPDFKAIAPRPGMRRWSMVGYDIDARGKPVRLRTVAGSRDAALDQASLRAVGQSRFEKGARTGCVYPYWKTGSVLPAPQDPDVAAFRAADANCPVGDDWAKMPVLVYPDNYRRRSIEGWAIIGFDVAPWGEVGNARVLAAEPAADFGEAALNVIRGAAKAASPRGATGCVDKVRFVISDKRPRADTPYVTAAY